MTARRAAEQVGQLPLAVDVIAASETGAGAVEGLQSLAARVPGLSFEAIWGGANAFPVLRGQSQPSAAGDNVGMFVDGVYQASRDALDVEPLDLERIEVVKGPQSALFGHSSFAGLISFVPAPATEDWFARASLEADSAGLAGAQAAVSGPIDETWKFRLAGSRREANGTWHNAASPGSHLGGLRRIALAGTLATREGAGPLSLRLTARYGGNRYGQAPFITIDHRHNNCGGFDASAQVWSYYCGAAPISGRPSVSPDIPDSRSRTAQAALHVALDLGRIEVLSDTAWYRSSARIFRDFDGTADGEYYGVCAAAANCAAPGSQFQPVLRLQQVNIVQLHRMPVREISQELRLRSLGTAPFSWSVGGTAFWTRQGLRTNFAYGASRGGLAPGERFTSLVLASPLRVGPLAAINQALADDPNTVQTVQNDARETRRTLAVFASADYRTKLGLEMHGELRASWERLRLDSRLSNFEPGFGTGPGVRHFSDVTGRISIDYRPAHGWLAFASLARGARSGGINAVAGLAPEEQTFSPETNRTTEIGLRYSGTGLLRSASLVAYNVDWRDTQILGFATTRGVNALILGNTSGIRIRGVELSGELHPRRWLGAELAMSYTHPRFNRGSEDPGSGTFCGLGSNSSTSSFCTIRPSGSRPGQLAPDISGNTVPRAPELSWSAALTIEPRADWLRGSRLRLGLSAQDNVFERAVNGLKYGKRRLLDARLTVPLGRLSAALWGTNLTNDRYARVAVGRQPQFYIGIPRPTDLILGERRRIGLSLAVTL